MTDLNNSDTNPPPPSEDSIPETSQPNNHNIANEEQAPVPNVTDRKRPADLPPTPEDSIPKIPRNNIEDVVNEEQALAPDLGNFPETKVTIADLEQIYINWIAEKMIDPRTLGRLQQTCWSLDQRGARAERLLTLSPCTIEYKSENNWKGAFCHQNFNLELDLAQFKATKFRFQADMLKIDAHFTPRMCRYVTEFLKGRGTIKAFVLDDVRITVHAIGFNKFIKDFHISELKCYDIPFFLDDHPSAFQDLGRLEYGDFFPLPLTFVSNSAIHSGSLPYDSFDFDELYLILRKWANYEKVVEDLALYHHDYYDFKPEFIFPEWRIVSGEEEKPLERPLVIRDTEEQFRLVRSDKSTLVIGIRGSLFYLFHLTCDDDMEQFRENMDYYAEGLEEEEEEDDDDSDEDNDDDDDDDNDDDDNDDD